MTRQAGLTSLSLISASRVGDRQRPHPADRPRDNSSRAVTRLSRSAVRAGEIKGDRPIRSTLTHKSLEDRQVGEPVGTGPFMRHRVAADAHSVGGHSFLGGLRAGGWGATWPLIRLAMDESGATIAPASRWLDVLLPTYEFRWDDVQEVDLAAGLFGGPSGIRFVLKGPARSARRYSLPRIWPVPVRRPAVWLPPGDLDRAFARVPPQIPRGRCRLFF
jgi:hypothetical protein